MGKNKNIAAIISEQGEKPTMRGVAGLIGPQSQEPRSHYTTVERPIRPSRGYKIRLDFIYQYKLLAVKQHRKLYEVMEEALEEYLTKHKAEL